VRTLLDAGVVVAAGGDNVQDPFNTVGRGDPLEIASLLVSAAHLGPEEAYRLVSTSARALMGLPEVRVEPGYPAELLAIRAESVLEAVAMASPERVVIHQGRVVARTTVQRELPAPATVEAPAPAAAAEPPAAVGRSGSPS
jgi:cytosine deaminase